MTATTIPVRPYSIAHRGASAYAPANTLAAFRKAAELGADMWEVDIRASSDGVSIVHHDAMLETGEALNAMTRDALRAAMPDVPDLSEVVALAAQLGAGIYADIKDVEAALPTLHLLQDAKISPVIIGAFNPEIVQILKDAGSTYPIAGLVPIGADPHSHAADADVIHLCWEHLPAPQDTLTKEFFGRAFADGKQVVLWHEEDPARMAAIRTKPVTGICSDMPELVNPLRRPSSYPFGVVCHRGANSIAPENTLPALECALAAGFDVIEVDLHITSDSQIAVIHDPMLDRTTNGTGPVTQHTMAELRSLDAGSWFDPFFKDTTIPTLEEILDLIKRYDGRAYLEFKSAPPEPVLEQVKRAGMLDRVFFWSFNRDFLVTLRQLSADALIMARREDYPSLAETIADYDANMVEFTPHADAADIASLRGSAVRSMVAYMGKDPEVFDHIIRLRPDQFNLNQPFAFVRHANARVLDG
ncbi:glycerophosphodiester phosphodiesterase [Flavimaricola marinus]|uniref:Glycerophosphoryl diester phosphodiesterase n=1 Tax=Flavimaricola marinus TaxID=1819565 RepID=A0A238LD14_9RHOB|nr:glycerophosphodiester phosphodiesterase family protein [Flavimaricola marinus]SMY07304.1 Glycerophosphoryl diester phosphodiesterase [Flavimaricola marinus]